MGFKLKVEGGRAVIGFGFRIGGDVRKDPAKIVNRFRVEVGGMSGLIMQIGVIDG